VIRRTVLATLALAALLLGAVDASAQEADSPTEEMRFHFGPLGFTPSIALSNFGIDNNVFNSADQAKQDTTAAVGPAVRAAMRLGRSMLTGTGSAEYLYFNTYTNQRALNSSDEVRWQFHFARLIPYVRGEYATTKNRPGYEIDSRSRQQRQAVEVGAELKLSAKTRLIASASRGRIAFDAGETFFDVNLADELNRRTDSQQLQLRHQLTSLTTLVVVADAMQDRFITNTLRSSDSIRVMPGFEMKPSALISGHAAVGFRQLTPLSASVPSYRGVVAAVDTKYLVTGATQLAVSVSRDLAYSYQPLQPYYTLTDVGVGVTQRISYTWDMVAGASHQSLDYHQLTSLAAPTVDTPGGPADPVIPSLSRVDSIEQYTAGIGYRLGRTLRIGVDGIYYKRHSLDVHENFDGLRFGASVKYGLKP